MNSHKRQRSGAVLMIVVVLVLLMSLAAYDYLLSMQTENLAARSSGDRLVARQAAFSARDLLMVLMEKSRAERQALGGLRNNPALFAGSALVKTEHLEDDYLARGFVVCNTHRTTGAESAFRYGAVNESSKLHLMKLVQWDQQQPESGRHALLQLPGMDEATADAILDWVDADSQPRLLGAEADYYTLRVPPITPRNAMPTDLEELLLIRGVGAARLFGTQMNAKPQFPGETVPGVNELTRPWVDFLTVYSGERNETRAGIPRVFVNDSRLDLVHQRLLSVMPVDWANFIILYRQFGPSAADRKISNAGQITIDFTVAAAHEIENPLDLVAANVMLTEGDEQISVASPFSSEPLVMQNQLPRLVDQITVVPETRLIGRVNINLAPREVILGIPGIDEAVAERMIAARTIGDEKMLGRDHPVWLLTEGIVDLDTMRLLLPNVTAGGDVYRSEFGGIIDDRSPMFRFEAILDASVTPARQVYYRELVPKQVADWSLQSDATYPR